MNDHLNENEYLAKRADLVARADAATEKVKHAIWDLIAALDEQQPERDPLAAARARLADWPDQNIRFGGWAPAEVQSIPIPTGFVPMEVHGPFAKRNRERAENKGGREAGVQCPKNAGEPHIWHKITRKRGGVTTKVNLCAKCKTRRLISRDVVSVCPGYAPIKKGRQSIERGGAQRWGCSHCGMAESSHIKVLRPIEITMANEIKARAEVMPHRRQA